MARVAVSRLRLRAPPALARRAVARAEDALRLAAPEGERLLVLRRLRLGRLPVTGTAALWEARAGAALREAGGRALHASAPGAAAADAVWFASVAEARWLLLRELAAGRRADAWFWRLAVPDWQGAALPEWVPRLAAQALAEPQAEVALASAVLRLAGEGALAPLLHALAFAPEPPRAKPSHPPATPLRAPRDATPSAAALAMQLLARLPPLARARLHAAIRAAPAQRRAARWLARLALLAAAPEAAAQPTALAALAEALLAEILAAPRATARESTLPAPDPPPPPLAPRTTTTAEVARIARAAPDEADAPARSAAPPILSTTPPSAPAPPPGTPALVPPIAPLSVEELHSRAAGVMLLIRPLVRLGLPGWLDRHPHLAATGFARGLLRHIALRHRIPPEDPLLAVLIEDAAHPPAALDAWRVGLDRWLRRRARRRLAGIVRRPGWLSLAEDRLLLRFPPGSADLNLRRLALDVDPGWVPWLGLAIRYAFRDHRQP